MFSMIRHATDCHVNMKRKNACCRGRVINLSWIIQEGWLTWRNIDFHEERGICNKSIQCKFCHSPPYMHEELWSIENVAGRVAYQRPCLSSQGRGASRLHSHSVKGPCVNIMHDPQQAPIHRRRKKRDVTYLQANQPGKTKEVYLEVLKVRARVLLYDEFTS